MREGDDREFEEFVARSGDRLLRITILLVGDRGTAEDLVQGALERTYRHWSRVSAGHPEAYVRRALVNAAASRFRRFRVREEPLGPDSDVGSDHHTEQLLLRDELARALLTLPVRQRAVLVLRYLDDMSESEIAATLGCSPGTVKTHASRGLARLRASSHLTGGRPDESTESAEPTQPAVRRKP